MAGVEPSIEPSPAEGGERRGIGAPGPRLALLGFAVLVGVAAAFYVFALVSWSSSTGRLGQAA